MNPWLRNKYFVVVTVATAYLGGLGGTSLAGAGQWLPEPAMAIQRALHTATRLEDGRVLVTGGNNNFGPTDSAQIYDPAGHTWTPFVGAGSVPSMTQSRTEHAATWLGVKDGRVLVSGGHVGVSATANAEIYDPVNNVWLVVPPMNAVRSLHTSTLLNDRRVLVAGGYNNSVIGNNNSEIYLPSINAWDVWVRMNTARYLHTATLLSDGRVLVTGGQTDSGITNSAEIYDPKDNKWTAVANMNSARSEHTATLLSDGRVLVTGGKSSSSTFHATAEIYDPTANSWTVVSVPSMSTVRFRHAATLLNNGAVLVAGGATNSGNTTSAEIYIPAANVWTSISTMNEDRALHRATLLGNGKVLVTGGALSCSGCYTAGTEIYDNVDTNPPDTKIASAPPQKTDQTDASFSFVSSEGGSLFQCRLDGAPYIPCNNGRKNYRRLSPGTHIFEVQAVDDAGNIDPKPATWTWTIIEP
jgi:Galactose oxidase, central domain/Kelch motif